MDNEIWKPIPGYEGVYEISNMGRVKSIDRSILDSIYRIQNKKGRVLAFSLGPKGRYYYVNLHHNKPRRVLIHRLVAQAFLPDWDETLTVNHINGHKLDNRADNLEMCTPKENIQHAIKHKLRNDRGERNANAALTLEDVYQIRKLHNIWGFSLSVLARNFGVSKTTIHKVVRHKTYNK